MSDSLGSAKRGSFRKVVRVAALAAPAFLAVAAMTQQASAADAYWDADTVATGNNASTGAGLGNSASNIWDTGSSVNFWDGVSASDQTWSNGNNAIFFGAAGGVTSFDAKTVTGLTFKSNGYSISGSTMTVSNGGTITTDTGVTATLSSSMLGAAGETITKAGPGTLTLNNPTPWTGGFPTASSNWQQNIHVTGGTLEVTGGNGFLPGRGDSNQFNGTNGLLTYPTITLDSGTTLRFAHTSGGSNRWLGQAAGAGGLLVQSSGGGATETIFGNNTYTGPTTIAAGSTLRLGAGGTITPSGSLGNTAVAVTGQLRFRNDSEATTFPGSSSGTGTVIFEGLNTITLTGTNSPTGGTTVNVGAGAVALNNPTGNAISGPVSFSSGTLRLTNNTSDSTGAALTLNAASTDTLDMAGATGTFAFGDSSLATWNASALLNIINWNGTLVTGGGAEQVKFGSNNSSLTAGQLAQLRFVNPAGLPSGTYNALFATGNPGEVVPAPEPASLTLLGIGGLAMLGHRRRRA